MKQAISTMLGYQDAMNTRVNANWREQGFAWYRAIWIESAELMDHYGWKWWKKQSPDIEQVKLELIDIWHFGLSHLIEQGVSAEGIEELLAPALESEPSDFRDAIELFAAQTLIYKGFLVDGFGALMRSINLSFDELFAGYMGKNVLNFFRQDHGYQEGTYQKLWAGKEDNEHLVEIIATLDSSDEQFKDTLYSELRKRYQLLNELVE